MRRFILGALVAAVLFVLVPALPGIRGDGGDYLVPPPATAWADTFTWNDGPPKRPEFTLYCNSRTTVNGDTYIQHTYISGDMDQPRDSEIRWMQGYCDMISRRAAVGYFLYQKGIDIDPNVVEVSWKGP